MTLHTKLIWLVAMNLGSLGIANAQVQNRPATNDCEVGTTITAMTPNAGVARNGSVYSSTLYDPLNTVNNTSMNPKKIQIRVTKNGAPKANCSVIWQARNGNASGWVFPDSTISDQNGYVSAWWVAGSAQNQSVDASIQQTDGVIKLATISGTAYSHSTRSNSIHVQWDTSAWSKFRADITPLTWQPTTYYEVIGFNGGYSGIQNTQTLFSLWDINGVSPIVIDSGISRCSNFGGEGTGIKCEAPFSPKTNITYRFELEINVVAGGMQDYTMYFTDTSTNQRNKLATLRLPYALPQSGAYGFVEDWATDARSCLDNPIRSAVYSNVWYFNSATQQWINSKTAKGDAVYTPNHNEICTNYNFDFSNGTFMLSSGGTNVGYPLNMPASPATYPIVQASAQINAGFYKLINTNSGMALDVTGGSRVRGTNIEIWPDNAGGAQVWYLKEIRSGVFNLINPQSNMALDVTGGSLNQGTTVEIWDINGAGAQEWRLVATRDGTYNLINPQSGLALDVTSSGTSPGVRVQTWTPNGTKAQEWKLIAL
ncbi:DUF3472 domain-containing protein [Undibacterium sp. RuRC25W]|uniref:DUF3472 domain-containing protein n=1 Tax=Undibacterium sp. RuRC25W TaxID=3413047 RepID=UPI003BF25C40